MAYYGAERKIGFWSTLILSLIFSPVVGFMCVLLSERKQNFNSEKQQNNSDGFDIEQFRRN
jgi:hypothetical protein